MADAATKRANSTRPSGKPLPLVAAAAIIGGGWVLPLVFVAVYLPRFVRIVDELTATGVEMPALTRALIPLGRLGPMLSALIGAGFVAIVVGGYAGWVRARLPGGRVAPALVLAAAGMVAFFVCLAAVLLPVTAIAPRE